MDTKSQIAIAPIITTEKVDLFKTLPEKGLNCLLDSKIEHVMCTSALSAFN